MCSPARPPSRPRTSSSLTSPEIQYPSGLQAEALKVAATLGVPTGAVIEELPGTSVGAKDVEVFLPVT